MLRIESPGAGAPGVNKSFVLRAPRQSARSFAALASMAAVTAAMGGCASTPSIVSSGFAPASSTQASYKFPESKWGVSASRRVAGTGARIPKGGGHYKVGAPYQVGGRWYRPREQRDYDRVGIASWYGKAFHGRKTANGEIFDMHALTAAHPTLPMPSYAYVSNPANGRTILVRINDRGPYVGDRMIDLSRRSAHELGLLSGGTGRVRVQYAGPAPLNGDDRRERHFLASRSWKDEGSRNVAAVERVVSQNEMANYEARRAPRRPALPPARSGMEGAWSPYAHRERIAAR